MLQSAVIGRQFKLLSSTTALVEKIGAGSKIENFVKQRTQQQRIRAKMADEKIKAAMQSGNADELVSELKNMLGADVGDETEKLNKLRDILTDSIKAINNLILGQAKAEVSEIAGDLAGETYLELPDAQFLEPRGRFKMTMSTAGMFLEGKSASCFITWDNITHAVTFPAYQTTKKEGEDLVAIRIDPGTVKYNGKDLKYLLWNLGKSLGKPVKCTNEACPVDGTESVVVTTLLEFLWRKELTRPRSELFQTIAAKDAKSYLLCYKGTQEGAIYPLECGVVFIKPTLFLPAEKIASLSAGRGGGSGQTRYVDLKIETADDEVYEFTNIEREQLPALQGYVKGYLEMRKKAEEEAERARKAASGEEPDEDDSDEDDDDFDPDASDDDEDDEDASGSGSDDSDDDSDASEGDTESEKEDERGPAPAHAKQAAKEKEGKKKGVVNVVKSSTGAGTDAAQDASPVKASKQRPPPVRIDKKEKKVPAPVAAATTEEDEADALMRAAYQSSFHAVNNNAPKAIKREREEVKAAESGEKKMSRAREQESHEHDSTSTSPQMKIVDVQEMM